MAGAVLIGARGTTTGNSLTTGAGTSSANASFAACISFGFAGLVSAVTDNKGNTYVKQGATSTVGGRTDLNASEVWVAVNGVGGAGHVLTVTFTNSSVFAVGHLIELQGVDTASPVDVVITAAQLSTPPLIINTGTLSQADEVILVLASIVSNSGTATYVDGTGTYSLLSQETDNSNFWTSSVWAKVVSSATETVTSIAIAESATTFPVGNLLTFKVAASGGVTATFNLTDDSDTATATASIASSAALGVSDAIDTLSSAGTVITTSGVFQTGFQPGFQGVSGGVAGVVASLSLFDVLDSVSATSGIAIASSLVSTDALDAVSSGTSVGVSATANLPDAPDSVSGSIAPAIGDSGVNHHVQGPTQNLLQVTANTQASGSTFIVFHTGLQGNADPTDNHGNDYSAGRLTSWTAQPIWPSYGIEMFGVVNGVGGAGHTFTVDKAPSTRPDEEATAIVVEVIGGTTIVGATIGYVATANPPYTSPTVTVDGPAIIFLIWAGEDGGGPHTVSADNGFTFVNGWLGGVSGSIQFALFSRAVTVPGTYGATFTSTPSQGGLFGAVAVLGGTGDANASVSIAGVLSQTDAADTLAGQGSVTVSGASATLIQTDAIDTLASTASGAIAGAASVSDGVDTLSGVTAVSIVGLLSQVDAQDQSSSTAKIDVASTLTRTDAQDSLGSGAAIGVSSALAQVDALDSLGSGAAISVSALLALSDAADILSASGLVSVAGTISGTFDQTDSADTVSAAGVIFVGAGSNIQDQLDTLAAGGSVAIVGSLSSADAIDTLASGGTVTVAGAVTATLVMLDSADTTTSGGVVSVAAAFTQSDAIDSAIANGSIFNVGNFSQTDSSDTLIAIGVHFVPGRKLKPRPDSAVRVNAVTSKVIGVATTQGVISNAATTAIGEPQS